jgi:hypothetical protein
LSDIEKADMELAIRLGQSYRPYQDGYQQKGQHQPFWRNAEARLRNALSNLLHS